MAGIFTADELRAFSSQNSPFRAVRKKTPQARGNFLTHLLPTGGGIGGSAAGAAIGSALLPGLGTLAGALIGGAVGGGSAKVAENALEHRKLTSGVAGEAALNGVLGAGPIRLLKAGVGAGSAIKTGGGLVDALRAGNQAAQAPSIIKTAVGNKLGGISDSLASKALGITKGQKNQILEKTGEKAGVIAKKYGITQASDVPGVVKPMYNEFSKTVTAIPRTFSKQELDAAFKKVYEPLLAKGQPLGHQNIGQAIKGEADNLLKGVPAKGISAVELNTRRQAFDKLAYKAKGTDPAMYDINKQSRDVLSGLIHGAADSAGLKTTSGLTLKQLGKEIQKVERLGKAANKNIEGAGGHMAIGLGNTPLTIVGAGAGPAGAATGLAANMVVNSGVGRRVASKALDKAATRSTTSAARTAANPFGLKAVTKRVAPVGLTDALLQSSNTQDNSVNAVTNASMPTNAMNQEYAANANLPSGDLNDPFDPANVKANIQSIIANGGTMTDVSKYVSLVDAVSQLTATAGPKLNATQLQQANNANSGLSDLGTLAEQIQNNPSVLLKDAIPGGSIARRLTGTTDFDAAKQNIVDVIARLRSGAAITQDEANRYMRLLPTLGDSQESAMSKLARLQGLLGAFANPQAAQGVDASSLASALGT